MPFSTGGGTSLKYDAEEGKLQIVNISRTRFWFTVAVSLLRVVIAGQLCYYGILYVGYTLQVEELLLNAVALEFIISVDEALFESLMPRAIKQFYDRLRPLRLPAFTSYRGVDLRGAITLIGVLACFGATLGGLIVPQVGPGPIS